MSDQSSINVQQSIEQITGGTVIGVRQIISQLNPQEKRNRQIMLQKVREFWVEGVLEKSLYREVLIELSIQVQNEAVIRENPWSMIVQQAGQPDLEIPPGADISGIAEVFDRSGRALLILGAPGAGKTTTMLTLARDLINRAQADETHAIPVVFNLSSWANERKALAEWLKDELFLRYQVPKKVAAAWVEGDFVLPLLDGLDEVRAENRNECVEAINKFREQHGHTDAVVCSRIADYEALTSKLKLGGAVTLQPLTMAQVEEYLSGFLDELASVRTLLKEDEPLQKLAESPLMLSVMTLAYRWKSVEELQSLNTIEARRKHLFHAYVQAMFNRPNRSGALLYLQQKTLYWLSWLAKKLVLNEQSMFYIETLQPNWLDTRLQFFSFQLFCWLSSGIIVGLGSALAIGLTGGLANGLVSIVAFFSVAVVIGLNFDAAFHSYDKITLAEKLGWNWAKWRPFKLYFLVFGLIIIFITSQIYGLNLSIIAIGVIGSLFVMLFGSLIEIIESTENIYARKSPNKGVYLSIQNFIKLGFFPGVFLGLVTALIFGILFNHIFGLAAGIIGAGFFGVTITIIWILLVLVRAGGFAVFQHIALRFLLWWAGYAPLNYARFLDYCAERIILRKVGGGYIFIHRLLMEYFAELDVDTSTK
jgi:DNA polymerase III delta prime subunit